MRRATLLIIATLGAGCVLEVDGGGGTTGASAPSPTTTGTDAPPDVGTTGDETPAPEGESSSGGGEDSSEGGGEIGSSSTGGGESSGGEAPSGFAGEVLPILAANCSCHRSPTPSAGLDLNDDAAYDSLVSAPAGASGLSYIEPGDPEQSYAIHKVRGTHAAVGGVGSQMPLGGQLSAAELQTMEDWVAEGAAP